MLALDDVRYAWPGGSDCLALPRLTLAAGQSLFLHGSSGCGKSTLLGLMAGVLLPRQGRVSLMGVDWASLPAGRRDARRADHVGVIFQQFNLLPYLSVLDNVRLPTRFSRLRAQRCKGDPQAQARALLDRMGLGPAQQAGRADALSVGQQQRVAAARALIGAPELVIADEPTSALDAPRRDSFMQLLRQACAEAGSTLVFVSHDERLAEGFDQQLALPALNRAAVEPSA